MAEEARSIRDQLASLRIDRGVAPKSGWTRRQLQIAGASAGGLLAVLVAIWIVAATRPVPVSVAYATHSGAGGAAPAAGSVLSGSGYVVTGEKYISIGVRVAGRIDAYLVEESDRVKAGQPLVKLDSRDYEASLQRAEAGLKVARANLELRRREIARLRELVPKGFASQAELDIKENEVRVSQAQVEQLEAEVALAKVNLDYTVLRAPTDGVILAKLKEVGEIAVPGGFAGSGELVRLANLSDMRAEVDVNEADLSRVRLNQAAEVIPDAYPDRKYGARVVKLYPQVNRQKGTLKVEVKIENADEILRPDMSVRINFLGEAARASEGGAPVVMAPKSAVRTDEAGAFVWVVSQGRARRQPIRSASDLGDQIVVAEGLLGGEALVVGDAAELSDGQRVEVTAAAGD